MRVGAGFRFEPSASEMFPFLSLESVGVVGVSIRCGYMVRNRQEGTLGYKWYWLRWTGFVAKESVFLRYFLTLFRHNSSPEMVMGPGFCCLSVP